MSNLKHLSGLLAFCVACAVSVQSQTALTSVHGTVTDSSGAPVPDAEVTADNNATALHLTRRTDSTGEYSFLQLVPGRYVVTVLRTGFANESKEAELLVDQPATINFTLSVQGSKVTVEGTILWGASRAGN